MELNDSMYDAPTCENSLKVNLDQKLENLNHS